MATTGPTTDHVEIREWADMRGVVPVELFPHIVDHLPAAIQLVPQRSIGVRKDLRILTWEEFFSRFDNLGLTCVYDDAGSSENELLQIEDKSPFRNTEYTLTKLEN